MNRLRIRHLEYAVQHRCCICGADAICAHLDLDFRTAGYVCGECKEPDKIAEINLINAQLSAPIDRALDQA